MLRVQGGTTKITKIHAKAKGHTNSIMQNYGKAKTETIQINQQNLLQGNPHAKLVGYELNNATGRSHDITKPLSGGRVLNLVNVTQKIRCDNQSIKMNALQLAQGQRRSKSSKGNAVKRVQMSKRGICL